MKEKRQRYNAHGLVFGSDFDLGANNITPGNEYDVLIEEGSIPMLDFKPLKEGVCYCAGEKDFLLTIPEVGRYWIHQGELIIVDPLPQANEQSIVLFLMGSAFGALFIQRRLLALHASAVEREGKAILFAGTSGAGKSTIGNLMQQRGYRFVTDDIAVINPQSSQVVPGFQSMKIWEDILVYLKDDFQHARRVRPNLMKYHIPARKATSLKQVPINIVYILRNHNKNVFTGRTLTGIEKFKAIKNNTYRQVYIAGKEAQKNHFEQCGSIAELTLVRLVHRPRNNKDLEKFADFIEKDLQIIIG